MGKVRNQYIAVTAAFIILVWTIDAAVEYYIAYPAYSFPGMFLLNIPFSSLVPRLIYSLIIAVSGYLLVRSHTRYLSVRKRIEEQEERYQLITEHSNDVIWTMDLNGTLTYISPAVDRLVGFTAAETTGKYFEESLTTESRKIAAGLFEHFLGIIHRDPGRIPSAVTELELVAKDGNPVWVEASVTIIPERGGNPRFFLGVSRDVSERKRREGELRQSEENYRLLAETTLDFIMVQDTEGFITYANSAVLKATLYTIEELKGLQLSNIIPGEYHHVLKSFAERREAGEKTRFLYEIEFVTREGRRMPVEVSSAPIMVHSRAMAELITARDISERKEAQKTLVENERRFRSYIENSPIPVFIIDVEGIIRFVNNATSVYLGYPVSFLIGKTYASVKPPGEKEKVPRQGVRVLKSRKLDDETRFLCNDGREVHAMVRGTALEDNSFIVYAVDISERILSEQKIRETDEKIRELNAGLEEMVKKRTAELQMANKELEAFSYSVSHDLRAPLRHISAFTRLIEQSPVIAGESKLRHYFENIISSVDKMNDLIESLLSFSRMGRMAITKTEVDFTSMAEDILEEMKPELSGRNIRIDIGKLGTVMADAGLIRLVWYNLIANAVKFTRDEKDAVITVGREMVGEREAFFVRDNGVGFDSTYKSKLFGVFQRLHSESEFEGTGIGLANVKRIVTRHGGEVWAESETGKGAAFYFSLP